jgi:hypothetical protein
MDVHTQKQKRLAPPLISAPELSIATPFFVGPGSNEPSYGLLPGSNEPSYGLLPGSDEPSYGLLPGSDEPSYGLLLHSTCRTLRNPAENSDQFAVGLLRTHFNLS